MSRRPRSIDVSFAAAARLVAACAVAAVFVGCGRAPQIAGNEKCLKAADALLTAITSQSPTLLEKCEANLAALRAADEIEPPAFDYMQSVIDEARAGEWGAARRRLVKLIKAQRAP